MIPKLADIPDPEGGDEGGCGCGTRRRTIIEEPVKIPAVEPIRIEPTKKDDPIPAPNWPVKVPEKVGNS